MLLANKVTSLTKSPSCLQFVSLSVPFLHSIDGSREVNNIKNFIRPELLPNQLHPVEDYNVN